jgi:hypothetical protein
MYVFLFSLYADSERYSPLADYDNQGWGAPAFPACPLDNLMKDDDARHKNNKQSPRWGPCTS